MTAGPDAAPAPGRHRVLLLLCLLAMITYLDRVCFGAAARVIASDLGYSDVSALRWAFTAFALAYAVFEIPSGWIGDVLGPRSTLVRIVLVWSVCTAATGLVGWKLGGATLGGLSTLIVIRFLFGAGEAGAFPNITRALHNWFPPGEWSTAHGFIWMSGRIMGGITPLVWTLLVVGTSETPSLMSWRTAFVLFGVLGLAWCAIFATTFRDRPTDVRRGSRAPTDRLVPVVDPTLGLPHASETSGRPTCHGQKTETQQGTESSHAVPWRDLLTSPNMWAICLMYFGTSFGWYFNITYLPTYLEQRYDVLPTSTLGALYKGGPLWIGAAGCLLGGFLGDRLARLWRDRRRARVLIGVTGHSLAALCWFIAPRATTAHLFFIAVSLTAFFNDLTLSSAWATCQDVGGRHTAVVSAWMNTVGTFGAAAAGWLTGWLVERAIAARAAQLDVAIDALDKETRNLAAIPGYESSFLAYAVVYLLTAALWTLINPARPVVRDDH